LFIRNIEWQTRLKQKKCYKMSVIYKIVNTINGKFYIGSTVNFENRKYLHTHKLRQNKHHSPVLQNSWNKYGKGAFEFEIIERVKRKDRLIEREQFWMDKLLPTFNCSPTAESPLGMKHTAQSRKNMSRAHIGIKPTKEALAKRSLKQSGKFHHLYGKQRSQAVKDKISKGLKVYYAKHGHPSKGLHTTEKAKQLLREANWIPILQYTIDGEFVKEWQGASVAAKELGLHASNIGDCLKGRVHKTGNFKWGYKN